MRTIAILALTSLTWAGCALETGEGEPTTGEAQEAMLTFTHSWSTSHFMRTRPFQAPRGGTLTVTSKAAFDDPAGCPPSYSVELIHFFIKEGKAAEEVDGIARFYPRNQPHTEIWTALEAGTYRVQLSTMRPPNACKLQGVVTVTVTP